MRASSNSIKAPMRSPLSNFLCPRVMHSAACTVQKFLGICNLSLTTVPIEVLIMEILPQKLLRKQFSFGIVCLQLTTEECHQRTIHIRRVMRIQSPILLDNLAFCDNFLLISPGLTYLASKSTRCMLSSIKPSTRKAFPLQACSSTRG